MVIDWSDGLEEWLDSIAALWMREPEEAVPKFLDRFFDALDARDLKLADEILAGLGRRLADLHPPWLVYCTGILAYERRQWDTAERLHLSLLDQPLEPRLRGRVLNELGLVSTELGLWQMAIQFFKRGLEVFATLDDPLYSAKLWKNLGIAYTRGVEQGELPDTALQQALDCHYRALTIFQAEGTRILEGRAWNELGTVMKALGRWDDALACYKRDLAICQAEGDARGMAQSMNNIGEVYLAKEDWRRAEAWFNQALASIAPFSDWYEEADMLTNLGILREKTGQSELAYAAYTEAISHIETLRAQLKANVARADFFASHTGAYARRAALARHLGYLDEAFATAERAKARAFIELLAGRPVRPPSGLPRHLLEKEQTLRQAIADIEASGDFSSAASERLADLCHELTTLRRRIMLYDEEFASFHRVEIVTLAEVQAALPDGAALLEYFPSPAGLLAFVITRQHCQARELPLSLAALRDSSFDRQGRLRGLLPSRPSGRTRPWLLEKLFDALLAPLFPWVADSTSLYVVPHGPLHYIPFHALYDARRGCYLCEEVGPIVMAPSATVLWRYCWNRQPSAHRPALVIGYGKGLRHAEAEAETVARRLGVRPRLGHEAKCALLLQAAKDYRYIHFSGQGVFNVTDPLRSGIVLSDGVLEAADILRRVRLEADLVTLSACDTGLHRVRGGDELVGLSRAFLYAGTPAVLVSLWAVDDFATRVLMDRFYAELVSLPAPAALARAQETLRTMSSETLEALLAKDGWHDEDLQRDLEAGQLGSRPFAQPYHWAPFVLIGTNAGRNS